MAESDSAEKSHEATPQKLENARKKGELPKSTDLTAAGSYLGLIIAIWVVGPFALGHFGAVLSGFFESADRLSRNSFEASGGPLLNSLMMDVSMSGGGFFAVPMIFVLIVLTVQRAWVFAPEKLLPKLSRISPISGAKNKFGANGLFEFGKSAFKLCVVSTILFFFVRHHLDDLISTPAIAAKQTASYMMSLITEFLLLIFLMTLLVGGVDYLWQVASHLRKNRMSRKEVEDESKANEGDPHHKQTRRQRGYEIAMNQMLSDVPKADVIMVNPTHYAVALQWDKSSVGAPVCIAKGVDEIAARIREIAEESSIPIHTDPPTTRAVFATVDIGMQIQPDHYHAVAAAIRFAEKMRRRSRDQ